MPSLINTAPLLQFIQQVKAAELSQQKEIRLDMKSAKALVFCLAELNSKLVEDYDQLLAKIQSSHNSGSLTIKMDGGGFL